MNLQYWNLADDRLESTPNPSWHDVLSGVKAARESAQSGEISAVQLLVDTSNDCTLIQIENVGSALFLHKSGISYWSGELSDESQGFAVYDYLGSWSEFPLPVTLPHELALEGFRSYSEYHAINVAGIDMKPEKV